MEVGLASIDNGNGSLVVIVELVGTPLALTELTSLRMLMDRSTA
jgi:hypothetical protein